MVPKLLFQKQMVPDVKVFRWFRCNRNKYSLNNWWNKWYGTNGPGTQEAGSNVGKKCSLKIRSTCLASALKNLVVAAPAVVRKKGNVRTAVYSFCSFIQFQGRKKCLHCKWLRAFFLLKSTAGITMDIQASCRIGMGSLLTQNERRGDVASNYTKWALALEQSSLLKTLWRSVGHLLCQEYQVGRTMGM